MNNLLNTLRQACDQHQIYLDHDWSFSSSQSIHCLLRASGRGEATAYFADKHLPIEELVDLLYTLIATNSITHFDRQTLGVLMLNFRVVEKLPNVTAITVENSYGALEGATEKLTEFLTLSSQTAIFHQY